MNLLLRHFCTALTFLTRIPWVHRFSDPDPKVLAQSSWSWPLIGALLAGLQIALLWALLTWLPLSLIAWIVLGFGLLLTGAFHEDGFADTADGFWGGFTPARRLEIMKDSRLGTYGTVAVIVLLGLKVALLTELLARGLAVVGLALSLAHVWSRTSSLLIVRWLPYVRQGASNKPIADGFGRRVSLLGLLTALVLSSLCVWMFLQQQTSADSALSRLVWLLLIGLPLLWCGAASIARAKIGGITGDVLGAINQLSEVWVMLAVVIAWHTTS